MIDSPCTGVCQLDDEQRLCIGCGRTLHEIAAWPAADEAHRREILRAAAFRRDQLGVRPAA